MENKKIIGHFAALLTILIWGTTFISTKILLADFKPVEILFFRFVMGFLILLIIAPKQLKTKSHKEELTFILAGLCGICLYYLLENMALAYTLASNVGVIISVAPFFTAILAHLFTKSEEKLSVQFFAGFVVAMIGIVLISFMGAVKTSVYIYIVPVITVITSMLILHENLTLFAGIGTMLTLIGLFLSEYKLNKKGNADNP